MMDIRKFEVVIDSLDCIVTISYVKDHEESYAIEKVVQVYESNAYIDYDEDALNTVVEFIGIDFLDKCVKEQLKVAA